MYYPQQRYTSELAAIRRQALLPDGAIGNIQAETGQIVDIRDTVARGLIPARHVIVYAADELGIRPEQVTGLMLVNLRARVEAGQAIAGKDATRGKRVFAPINGVVIAVEEGRIIIQEMPQMIKLDAGVRGRVVDVIPGRGVTIESRGAIIQGAWGNGRNVIAVIRWEPERGGLNSISVDTLDTTYKNEIVLTRTPLTETGLAIAVARDFAGIIAPSISANLVETVLKADFAVMLTEGFGQMLMNPSTVHLLSQFNGTQGMLDAAQPQRFTERRAELIINRPVTGRLIDTTAAPQPLEVGTRVRVTRDPYQGVLGTVVELPHNPLLLDNGLCVKCAVVELMAGEYVHIPLANLELGGI